MCVYMYTYIYMQRRMPLLPMRPGHARYCPNKITLARPGLFARNLFRFRPGFIQIGHILSSAEWPVPDTFSAHAFWTRAISVSLCTYIQYISIYIYIYPLSLNTHIYVRIHIDTHLSLCVCVSLSLFLPPSNPSIRLPRK